MYRWSAVKIGWYLLHQNLLHVSLYKGNLKLGTYIKPILELPSKTKSNFYRYRMLRRVGLFKVIVILDDIAIEFMTKFFFVVVVLKLPLNRNKIILFNDKCQIRSV